MASSPYLSAESTPLTLVQLQKLQRDLAEKVLDKACSDPQWKQQLIEDPHLAMREANFPEFKQLQQASQQRGAEVQGQWGHGDWASSDGGRGASARRGGWRYPSYGWWWQ